MKYELMEQDPKTGLYRIRALIDIPRHGVGAGAIGGFVRAEKNLSQKGDAWVFNNAKVGEDACVFDDANVYGNAWVSGDAKVGDSAKVGSNAKISGDACVFDNAKVGGGAWVFGSARVYGNAWVYDDAWVYGDAKVGGGAKISSGAQILRSQDYLSIGPLGAQNELATFYKTKTGISVVGGWFEGTIEEFETAVMEKHGNRRHGVIYQMAISMARARIKA